MNNIKPIELTKRQIAQKRNGFKFMLSSMKRLIPREVLTDWEIETWNIIQKQLNLLTEEFDENSRKWGLNVPKHKCWCGKEGKYIPKYDCNETYVCKKHIEI